jgi:hypothetical protein
MKFNAYQQFTVPPGHDRVSALTYLVSGDETQGIDRNTQTAALCELAWVGASRPFYQIYPRVADSLARTSLDIKFRDVFSGCLAVMFAKGCEPDVFTRVFFDASQKWVSMRGKARACIIWHTDGTTFMTFDVLTSGAHGEDPNRMVSLISMDDNALVSAFSSIAGHKRGDYALDEAEKFDIHIKKVVAIVAGVSLLSRDTDYCEKLLLKRDSGKVLTPEQRAAAEAKALKLGINGWTIGKQTELEGETSPHMRKPHFSIRWTGVGRQIPKLVPVKGSIVHREKILPVPTGYLGKEEPSLS